MAHLKNFTRGEAGAILAHDGRQKGDEIKRETSKIDPSRTHLNKVRCWKDTRPDDRLTPHAFAAFLQGKMREAVKRTNVARAAENRKPLYKSAAVMSSWVVTLPQDWPEDSDSLEFFMHVNSFMRKRYGKHRSYGMFIHMDETTPHAHCPIIPLDENGLLNRSKVLNRRDVKTFHEDLQHYMDEKLGFHVTLLYDEDDLVAKAKSKLTRKELNALEHHISDSVAQKTEERERELDERMEAVRKAKNGLDDLIQSVQEEARQLIDGLRGRNQDVTQEETRLERLRQWRQKAGSMGIDPVSEGYEL